MPHSTARRQLLQIETLRTQFAQTDGLPFVDLLTAERLEQPLTHEKATWREAIWTPVLTLWAFLSQLISPDGSCRLTVDRVLAWLVSRGEEPCSPKTDPYCKARKRLPESSLRRMVRETGKSLHDLSPATRLWQGRRVKIAHGTAVSMPDTPANQAVYPQPASQKPGLGFPLARMGTFFAWPRARFWMPRWDAIRASSRAKTRCCESWTRLWIRAMSCWPTVTTAAGLT